MFAIIIVGTSRVSKELYRSFYRPKSQSDIGSCETICIIILIWRLKYLLPSILKYCIGETKHTGTTQILTMHFQSQCH